MIKHYTLMLLSLDTILKSIMRGKVSDWKNMIPDNTIILFTVKNVEILKSYTYMYLKWDCRIRILKIKLHN